MEKNETFSELTWRSLARMEITEVFDQCKPKHDRDGPELAEFQGMDGLVGLEEMGDGNVRKLSIMGALTLYLDFINLFLFLLRFLGNRR